MSNIEIARLKKRIKALEDENERLKDKLEKEKKKRLALYKG